MSKRLLFPFLMLPWLAQAEALIDVLGPQAVLPPPLEQREVDPRAPLAGLNFVSDQMRTIVTGVNGDGTQAETMFPTSSSTVTVATKRPAAPEKPVDGNSLWPILQSIPLGEARTVELPNGSYTVKHDGGYDYGVEGKTWIGYLDNDKNHRLIVSAGEGTLTGTLITATARYSLVGNRWIDLASTRAYPIDKHQPAALYKQIPMAEAALQVAAPEAGPTVVDIYAFFDRDVGQGTPRLRIRHMVALANQAFVDSGINAQLRLVGFRRLLWLEKPAGRSLSNDSLLDKVSFLMENRPTYMELQRSSGADLITVIRPNFSSLTDCGVGFVGGSGGTAFRSNTGLSVVVEGIDELGKTSCEDYALAHEVGHNLGSAHDRDHANVPGHFPYSFGMTGTDTAGGQWHTIMAYAQSSRAVLTPVFSSPKLQCSAILGGGVPCGTNTENNARSIRKSVATVAGYMEATQ